MIEIEVYVQSKSFIAHNQEEVDRVLTLFKGWDEKEGIKMGDTKNSLPTLTILYTKPEFGDDVKFTRTYGVKLKPGQTMKDIEEILRKVFKLEHPNWKIVRIVHDNTT